MAQARRGVLTHPGHAAARQAGADHRQASGHLAGVAGETGRERGDVGPVLGLVAATFGKMLGRRGQRQAGMGAHLGRREGLQALADRGGAAQRGATRRDRPQERPGASAIATGDRVPEGLAHLAVTSVPIGGPAVQHRLELWLIADEVGVEHLRQEPVAPKPQVGAIDRLDRDVAAREAGEHRGGVARLPTPRRTTARIFA